MAANTTPSWTFLTNHAQVLVCIAHDPGVRLRDIGERVGITERAAHRIVVELADAGYITRQRNGRRNQYTINTHLPLPEPIAREQNVGERLATLTGPPTEMARSCRSHGRLTLSTWQTRDPFVENKRHREPLRRSGSIDRCPRGPRHPIALLARSPLADTLPAREARVAGRKALGGVL